MSISWKELGSMSPSHARLLLENLSYGRIGKNHCLISRDENQHLVLTQQILKKWADGDDPENERRSQKKKGIM